MTYLFFVQGEGRGHLTQALTLKAKLESRGHIILAVIAGPEPDSVLPAFFEDQFKDKLYRISSPRFVVDKNGQGISITASLLRTLGLFNRYRKSLKLIKQVVTDTSPDAIINFYEPLAGLYARIWQDKRRFYSIAHQFFTEHSSFIFPKSYYSDRLSIRFYNWLVSPGHGLKIALSFTDEPDEDIKRIHVCPPLIRQAFKDRAPTKGNYVLAYLLNSGYSQEVISWSGSNPDVMIEAFWNKPGTEITSLSPNLIFHNLHGEKFLDKLSKCAAYASTAGFESIAEAAYLQKEILMIPTKHHFEQRCNAADAKRAGLASISDWFDLSLVINNFEKTHSNSALRVFKEWVDNHDDKIIKILEA